MEEKAVGGQTWLRVLLSFTALANRPNLEPAIQTFSFGVFFLHLIVAAMQLNTPREKLFLGRNAALHNPP